jgi:glycosyltransferase involved in cell wall biosynthesis
LDFNVNPVSVVMPVHNAEKYLSQAIESILGQTFSDFEFIIVDDGSTDSSSVILERYQRQDKRIKVFSQKNLGVTAARNTGCRMAKGKFIAVMDSDDISLPERLERQYRFLESHAEVGICGTWAEIIDQNGREVTVYRLPDESQVIKWFLNFGVNYLIHSSVMMRQEIVRKLGFYLSEMIVCEDYYLWVRASRVTQMANIPEILTRYRKWEGGISNCNFSVMGQYSDRILHSMLEETLGHDVSIEEKTTLWNIITSSHLTSPSQIEFSANLIKEIHGAFFKDKPLDRKERQEINHDAGRRLYDTAVSASRISRLRSLPLFFQAARWDPSVLTKLYRLIILKSKRNPVWQG